MPNGNDFCNNQLINAALQNAGSETERGIPAVGKVVWRTDIGSMQVCISTSPNPTENGGGTWVTPAGAGSISYVGASTLVAGTGTSISGTLHASSQTGDLLVAVVGARSAGTLDTGTLNTGWFGGVSLSVSGLKLALWYTIAGNSVVAPTVTLAFAQDPAAIQVFTYRGVNRDLLHLGPDFSGDLDRFGQYSDSETGAAALTCVPTASAPMPSAAGFTLFSAAVQKGSAGMTITTANGFTSRSTATTTTGSDLSFGVGDLIGATQAANLTLWPTFTAASGTPTGVALGLVLRP